MHCFFLRLTNTLKQPDGLHFITSGLHFSISYEFSKLPGFRMFSERRYQPRYLRVTKYL